MAGWLRVDANTGGLAVLAHSEPSACLARTGAVRPDPSVCDGEFVSVCAMGHAAVSPFHTPLSSGVSHVVMPCADREVSWIDAPTVVATMHNMKSSRDLAFGEFIGDAMGVDLAPADIPLHHPIAHRVDGSSPAQAAVLGRSGGDLFAEPLFNSSWCRHNYTLYPGGTHGWR
jgi:hypothetical protein